VSPLRRHSNSLWRQVRAAECHANGLDIGVKTQLILDAGEKSRLCPQKPLSVTAITATTTRIEVDGVVVWHGVLHNDSCTPVVWLAIDSDGSIRRSIALSGSPSAINHGHLDNRVKYQSTSILISEYCPLVYRCQQTDEFEHAPLFWYRRK
jgi:hypothetical protein